MVSGFSRAVVIPRYSLTFCTYNRTRYFVEKSRVDVVQYSGFYFKRAFDAKLWQRAAQHTLRDDEAALSVARYILENPIRAGLAERVQDYPSCGSLMHPLEHILDAVAMMPNYKRESRIRGPAKAGRYRDHGPPEGGHYGRSRSG